MKRLALVSLLVVGCGGAYGGTLEFPEVDAEVTPDAGEVDAGGDVGEADTTPPIPQVAGTYRYTWQVRNCPQDCPGHEMWDGRLRGILTLAQDGNRVTGTLGYPDEDLATMYNDPGLRAKWTWVVNGTVGATLELQAPAPNTAWDDSWVFSLDPVTMSGSAKPVTSQGPENRGWTFSASPL